MTLDILNMSFANVGDVSKCIVLSNNNLPPTNYIFWGFTNKPPIILRAQDPVLKDPGLKSTECFGTYGNKGK